MNTDTKTWLIYQLKGLILIGVMSLILSAGTNMFRMDPIPWVEKRRLLKAGDRFPYVPLSAPEVPGLQKYLGIPPGKEVVTIVDVQAELLVIEVLNVFCFPCQSQSLALNKAYQMIEERPDLKDRIKIIGVALGNTKEVSEGFAKDYGLAFPVIPDRELRTEKIIGPGIHTPFSLFVRRDASGKLGLVAGTHEGPIEDPQVLFDGLLTLLKTEPGAVNLDELFRNGSSPGL
jgi:hypothetical protein